MQGAQNPWIYSGSPQAIQHHLGRKLQHLYAALPAEQLSDAMAALLHKIDAAERRDVADRDPSSPL